MPFKPQHTSRSIPFASILFALLGLAWCGYMAFPTELRVLCVTSGCSLIAGGSIGGVSLWWIGGAYFFILTILCLRGMRVFAWRFSTLALFFDSILLVIMFITGPCMDCLVVGFFFAATTFFLKPPANAWFGENAPTHPLILFFWVGLFLGNSICAVNEATPYLTINSDKSNNIKIYFSPSCPACRKALLAMGNNAILYPVKEKDSDFDAILRFQDLINKKVPLPEALERSLDSSAPVPSLTVAEKIVLSIQLLRNKSSILRQGFKAMPLIEINGMPKAWSQINYNDGSSIDSSENQIYNEKKHSKQHSTNSTDPLPWEENLSDVSQCGGSNEPCLE